ncbi:MAG: hypothetical protein GY938_13330 [Ketobacter sp.]|nr:hypothetical protein [Ketobacter sp.]
MCEPLTKAQELRKTYLFFKSALTLDEERELYELMDRPKSEAVAKDDESD